MDWSNNRLSKVPVSISVILPAEIICSLVEESTIIHEGGVIQKYEEQLRASRKP
jgi:hypothetical protein